MEKPPPPPPRSVRVHERQLSIESEPKTLFGAAMNAARKAALEVIREHPEEALKIFLKKSERTDPEFDDLNASRKKLIKYDKDEECKVNERS